VNIKHDKACLWSIGFVSHYAVGWVHISDRSG